MLIEWLLFACAAAAALVLAVYTALAREVGYIRARPGAFTAEVAIAVLGALVPYWAVVRMRGASWRPVPKYSAVIAAKMAAFWVLFETSGYAKAVFA
jgi:hypothetical protein